MVWRYSDEQIEFVRKVAPGRLNVEIAELFNEKFGSNLSAKTMKSLKANHKIRSGELPHRAYRQFQKTLLTDEQLERLKVVAAGRLSSEIAEVMKDEFGLNLSERQVKNIKKRHKIRSSVDTTFKKGNVPVTKGTKGKGMFNAGGNITSFKKGHKPANYKPVGSERKDHDGYILVKVQDHGTWNERWRQKHVVVWENAHGPIPDGFVVILLDGDKGNCNLDNLQLITQAQHLQMNRNGWRFSNPEATKLGATLALIKGKSAERRRGLKNEFN